MEGDPADRSLSSASTVAGPNPPAAALSLRPETPQRKRLAGPIGGAIAVLVGVLGKLKFVLLPVVKFFPVLLKTGGTMFLTIWIYAQMWGWWFALGFVVLILVHECGHLLAARQVGLKVGAPVFIPFMGAFIALKEAPRDAWIEAWVGIGGPLLGAAGAGACALLAPWTDQPIFAALAYTGCFLNLFNLLPIGLLDGGRIATALSPWLWVVGLVISGAMLLHHPNFLLVLIVLMSLPRLVSLFRKKSDQEKRYYEVPPRRRGLLAVMYFGLMAALAAGMFFTHHAPSRW